MKANKKQQKIKALYIRVLFLFKRYNAKFDVSIYFAVHSMDMVNNAFKTQNKDVLKQFENIFNSVPYNRKIENEILNSIRY